MSDVGYVVLTYKFRRRANRRWTAYCEELGIATFGRSLPEAEKKLEEAVGLHINTLGEVGERDRFFKEHHIEFYSTKPQKDITICMPLRQEVFVHPRIQRIPALSPA